MVWSGRTPRCIRVGVMKAYPDSIQDMPRDEELHTEINPTSDGTPFVCKISQVENASEVLRSTRIRYLDIPTLLLIRSCALLRSHRARAPTGELAGVTSNRPRQARWHIVHCSVALSLASAGISQTKIRSGTCRMVPQESGRKSSA